MAELKLLDKWRQAQNIYQIWKLQLRWCLPVTLWPWWSSSRRPPSDSCLVETACSVHDRNRGHFDYTRQQYTINVSQTTTTTRLLTEALSTRWTSFSFTYLLANSVQLFLITLSGNMLVSINVVTLRWTWLVPGWVTVLGQVNHLGTEPGTQVDSSWLGTEPGTQVDSSWAIPLWLGKSEYWLSVALATARVEMVSPAYQWAQWPGLLA